MYEHEKNTTRNIIVIIFLTLVFGAILLRTAWIGDDAYITMRTVDNFVHGYGLTWNAGERVQTYTHPLWMFLLTGLYVLTNNAYFTSLALSALFSLVVMLIFLAYVPKNPADMFLGWTILILSNAFIDYSTSGLENSATHLFILVFVLSFFRLSQPVSAKGLFGLSLVAGLSTLDRMDTVLLFIPPLLYLFWQQRTSKRALLVIAGFLPFILWELFSLIYYGFLVPNTYYAKLNTGLGLKVLLHQGGIYFLISLLLDPITLVVIGSAVLLALFKGAGKEKVIALGMSLYLGYILYAGGDFMSGRFFSAIFLVAVILLLNHLQTLDLQLKALFAIVIVFLGLISPSPSFNPPVGMDSEIAHFSGISDEQAYYFGGSGLIRWGRYHKLPDHEWVTEGLALKEKHEKVYIGKGIGYLGYYAGPEVHILDYYAIADPLMSRLPIQPGTRWATGHVGRVIPDGYLETITSGTNLIKDPGVAQYYEKLSIIVHGEIWSAERFKTILEMNLGKYDDLLLPYIQTMPAGRN
jgi:arabinofuranosyltransferase